MFKKAAHILCNLFEKSSYSSKNQQRKKGKKQQMLCPNKFASDLNRCTDDAFRLLLCDIIFIHDTVYSLQFMLPKQKIRLQPREDILNGGVLHAKS